MPFKFAIAQTEIAFERPAKNLAVAKTWISKSAADGCQAIFFPEMSFTGFSMDAPKIAPQAAEIRAAMRAAAREHRIYIGYGAAVRDPDGQYRNRYYLLDDTGETILDYAKLHPFSFAGEDKIYAPGEQIEQGELCGVPISVLLCYDLRFPEVFRLAARDAHLLLVPSNWPGARMAHFDTLLRARAIENEVYVLGVNCTGMQNGALHQGGSCLYAPNGSALFRAGAEPTLQYVDFTDETAAHRRDFPTRPDARLTWYAKKYLEYFE